MINPYQNRAETNRSIAAAEKVMRMTATVTTSGGAFIWGRATALQYLPEGWAASGIIALVAGLLAAGVAAWLTDLMFGQLLERATYDLLASRHPNIVKWSEASASDRPGYFKALRRAEGAGVGLVLIALLAFDAYTTFIIREPVAAQARRPPLVHIDSLRAAIEADQRAAVATIKAEADALKSEAAAAERRALAANPALVRLRDQGNGWAAGELSRAQRKASASAAKARAEREVQISARRKSDETYLADRIAEAEAANQRAQAQSDLNRSVFGGMYMAFTVIPKGLSIILRILMVVSFLAYSQRFSPDLTGDGIIDYKDVEEYYRQQKDAAAARRAAAQARRGAGGHNPAFR